MMKVVYKKDDGMKRITENCALKILAYFAVFDFPLTLDEIKRFFPPGINADGLQNDLDRLVAKGVVFKIEDFYSLDNNSELVKRKQQGYSHAKELLPKAEKTGRFLCRFPYVRGIGISGGLSKMSAHEKADFDFFIITRADRLWLARTFMHVFKKLTFLAGRQHYYCMNYYLDENALALPDRNMYTAIETMTLIPVCGEGLRDFFAANNWVSEWFAGYPSFMNATQKPATSSWLKKTIEWVFNNSAGNLLDNYLMKTTSRRWKKKQERKKLNYEGKEMALITGKHFAWSNPDSFQQKILGLYNEKLKELESKRPGQPKQVTYFFGK